MQRPVFHASLYDRESPPASYWAAVTPAPVFDPLPGDCETEVAVIGGGFTGLSAALHLARDHGIHAVVLEAGAIGWGASGRNAGFNTLPATKHATRTLFAHWCEDDVRAFFEAQQQGQALVQDLAMSEGFDLQSTGSGVFWVAHTVRAVQALAEEGQWLARAGVTARLLDAEEFRRCGHGGREAFGALHLLAGGGINPLALTYGLALAARRHGATVCAHSPVRIWRAADGRHVLETPQGRVRARKVVLATNAYRDGVDPAALQRRVLPAISNIVVTEPLSAAKWDALGLVTEAPMSDSRHLVSYYRRLPDGRLLFGARGDTLGDPGQQARMQARLMALIARKFPDAGPLAPAWFWQGLVALTRRFLPSLGTVPGDDSVHYAFGCFGSGVNTMPWMGRTIARRIAGRRPTAAESCELFRDLPAPLPRSPWLQRKGLQLAYAHYALLDALP
ncbi:FAD-binding oxidoreductase [Niveibacterium umoris]|uniref:Glycine/D-amino acid oxidase-like deaminating enzyme n=1 Tax=Niveibacterium umoris TaxID=1193620 RepID=A0A840BH15_9RHOO|nr:FAD-dependent oxidoreductase [Niveibacterium umoris]MBB4010958.1 glycine/D-amino acid oxidase-like deaminating enzyme [Niveibacterium umoris]